MNKQIKQLILQSDSIPTILDELCMDKTQFTKHLNKYKDASAINVEYDGNSNIKTISAPEYIVEYEYDSKQSLRNILYTVGNIQRKELYKNKSLLSSIDTDLTTSKIVRVCEYECGKKSYVSNIGTDSSVIYEYSYNEYGNKESILKRESSKDISTTILHNYEYNDKQKCIRHMIYLDDEIKETRIIEYHTNSKNIFYLDNLNQTEKTVHLEYSNILHSDIVTYFEEKDEDDDIILAGSTTILEHLNLKVYRDTNNKIDISYLDTNEPVFTHDAFENTNYKDYDSIYRRLVSEGFDNYNYNNYDRYNYIYDDNGQLLGKYSEDSMELLLYNDNGIEYKINLSMTS